MEDTGNGPHKEKWLLLDDPEVEALINAAEQSADEKLKKIRQYSNVLQATENLLVQCGQNDTLKPIIDFCRNELPALRDLLRKQIHS